MPKIANISFPKNGAALQFNLADETVEYLEQLVKEGIYPNMEDALTALTLQALNINNTVRKEKSYPVDFPFPPNKCPICNQNGLVSTQVSTQKFGYMWHCPNCNYNFKICPICKTGLIYAIDHEVKDRIQVVEYCTQCDYDELNLDYDNFKYIEFHDVVE